MSVQVPAAEPVHVGLVDLDAPLAGLAPGLPYRQSRLLVRLHGQPLGFVEIDLDRSGACSAERLRKLLHEAVGAAAIEHLKKDGIPPTSVEEPIPLPARAACLDQGSKVPPMSVVICTRDRAVQLAACLDALLRLDHPTAELIIVDNAPSDDATRRLVERLRESDGRLVYVYAGTPGLSAARNAGLDAASHEWVAFTDDDVLVDGLWLHGLARGIRAGSDTSLVTGLVPSAELETAAQQYFDSRVSWASSCTPRRFTSERQSGDGPLHPYTAGVFGTGANFAVRRSIMMELGGFDEALGAGTPTGGGEDLDAFVRVLRAGRALQYEPSALVWHVHRSGLDDLRRQIHAYGKGLSAYGWKYLRDPETRWDVLRRMPAACKHLARVSSSGQSSTPLPRRIVLHEWAGLVKGPLAYRRARSQRQSPG